MATRDLIIFKHDSALGNAPAHMLFDLVEVHQKDEGKPPRNFGDYEVIVDEESLPKGIEILRPQASKAIGHAA